MQEQGEGAAPGLSASAEQDFDGVVVAAGRSARCGLGRPKQFQRIAGQTLLERSVASLLRPGVCGVTVVIAADELRGDGGDAARGILGVRQVVAGGATRAESVERGLRAGSRAPYVLVHDAARPFASAGLVDAVIEATRRHGAAVPVLEMADTVKEVDARGRLCRTLPRDRLRRAQTPQGARRDWLESALTRARSAGLEPTDEASALEHEKREVFAVQGEEANSKITSAGDLEQARRLLEPPFPELRVGVGFDVHRRDADRPLVLGGVHFAGEAGLVGHSDADVVLHALMDALLGAAGLGDIGTHFPPGDPRFLGAASTGLAAQVARMIRQAGFEVQNVDLTLLAESPRIGSRAVELRRSIAACLGLDPARVGVKATTLERLGALGRGEGLACQAVALLRRGAA